MTVEHPWQEVLDPRLTERLLRPLVRPGRIDAQMSPSIIARYQRLNNRLPLLTRLNRPQNPAGFQTEALPIVYAQPLPLQERAMNFTADSSPAPSGQTSQPTVIQAKFERPTSLPTPETADGFSSNLPEEHRSLIYVQPPEVPPVQPLPALNQPSQNDIASLLPVQPPSLTDLANPEVTQPLVRPANSSLSMSRTSVPDVQVPMVLPLKQSLPPFEALLPMPESFPIVTAQMLTSTQIGPSAAQVPPDMQVVTRLNAAHPLGANLRPVLPISRSQADTAMRLEVASALPIVPVSSGSQAQQRAKVDTPLVFSIPLGSSVRPTGNGPPSINPMMPGMVMTATQSFPRVDAQPMLNPQTSVSSSPPQQQQKIDLNDLANQVERKLMRRLVVERERRGRTQ